MPDHQPGRRGQYALQPRHRRHRQGPPGPGAGRPGRRNGPGGGPGLHPVSDAQPPEGPRRVVPAGPGGPPGLSAGDEAHPGAAGAPDPAPGGGGGPADGKRPRHRRGAAHRGGIPGPGGGAVHRHLSPGPHHRGRLCGGLRSRRTPRGGPPDGEPAGPGPASAAVQNRHPSPGEPAKHRLFQNAAPGGGPRPCPSASRPRLRRKTGRCAG